MWAKNSVLPDEVAGAGLNKVHLSCSQAKSHVSECFFFGSLFLSLSRVLIQGIWSSSLHIPHLFRRKFDLPSSHIYYVCVQTSKYNFCHNSHHSFLSLHDVPIHLSHPAINQSPNLYFPYFSSILPYIYIYIYIFYIDQQCLFCFNRFGL